MIRKFFREFRRKQAIIAGIACPNCRSANTELVGEKKKGNRHCKDCGHRWKQPTNYDLDGDFELGG